MATSHIFMHCIHESMTKEKSIHFFQSRNKFSIFLNAIFARCHTITANPPILANFLRSNHAIKFVRIVFRWSTYQPPCFVDIRSQTHCIRNTMQRPISCKSWLDLDYLAWLRTFHIFSAVTCNTRSRSVSILSIVERCWFPLCSEHHHSVYALLSILSIWIANNWALICCISWDIFLLHS